MTRDQLEEMLRLALVAKIEAGKTSEDDRVAGIVDSMVASYNRAIEDAIKVTQYSALIKDIESLKIV